MSEKAPNVTRKIVLSIVLLVIFLIVGLNSFQKLKPFYFKMSASSMTPTILKNDSTLVNPFAYSKEEPQRWDIIVFKKPDDGKMWVSRIVGMPTEKIEIRSGSVYINDQLMNFLENKGKAYYTNAGDFGKEGKAIIIPKNMYFTLSDNSSNALDSRYWGFIPRKNIIGKVIAVKSNNGQVLEIK